MPINQAQGYSQYSNTLLHLSLIKVGYERLPFLTSSSFVKKLMRAVGIWLNSIHLFKIIYTNIVKGNSSNGINS